MSENIIILGATAASIGFFHTLLGPDHYLPFVMMAKARCWHLRKTLIVTVLCGIGHVLSSVLLGAIGIGFGIALVNLKFIESFRGDLAAWMLIIFGFVYGIWGIRQAIRGQSHTHLHAHEDGIEHQHRHSHFHSHSHLHNTKKSITPWALFVIFVLGPCEPLIPLLMFPAVEENLFGVIFVAVIFGIVTIATMTTIVFLATKGLYFLPLKRIERFTHAIAGGMIALSGLGIVFFGL